MRNFKVDIFEAEKTRSGFLRLKSVPCRHAATRERRKPEERGNPPEKHPPEALIYNVPEDEAEELPGSSACVLYGYWVNSSHTEEVGFPFRPQPGRLQQTHKPCLRAGYLLL